MVAVVLSLDKFYRVKNIKKFLIFIGIVFVFLASCSRYEIGVKHGEGLFSKKVFFRGEFPNGIRAIQVGNFNSTPEKEVVILSQWNLIIVSAVTYEIKKTAFFRQSVGIRPKLIDIKKDGSLAIALGGGGFGDVGLMTTNGESIWMYKKVGTSPRLVSGDLDRDGKLEFYIADYDGVHRLDESGREIWKKGERWEEEIGTCMFIDEKRPSVVTKGSDGNIRFRDSAGDSIKEVAPESVIYGLEIIKWPEDYRILARTDYDIIVLNFDGKVLLRHKLQEDIWQSFVHLIEIMDIRGTAVRFRLNERPYLAVVAKHRAAIKRSTLSIFSPEGELIYKEMLHSSTGISALPTSDGSESLLIGDGEETVWIYNMREYQ
jgi:hypothetical protein